MSALTHGDLFAGIAGFSLAAQRAGMRTLWQVEIDPIARSVLARHWPDVARYEDVTTVSGHDLAPVDVITAGFPCQDLSIAGKRGGLEGARSGLFWEITRIVTEMREATNGRYPGILLLENVPGWLSSHGGRDFGVALDGLADCGALAIGWRILDARHFRVAQRRRRLFLVCDFIGRRASQVLFEPDSLSGHPAPRREERQTTPPGAPGGTGSGGGYSLTGDAFWREGVGPLAASDDNRSNQIVASAITASAGHHGHSSPRGDGSDNLVLAFTSKDSGGDVGTTSPTLRAMNYDQSHLNGGGQVAVAFDTTQITSPLNYSSPQPGGQRVAGVAGAHPPAVAFNLFSGGARADRPDGGFYVEDEADLARTLHTSASAIQTNQGGTAVRSGMTVRRLTPTECARLQSFPDDWIPETIADSHHYRLLGNSVCVAVVEWLLRRVVAAMAE